MSEEIELTPRMVGIELNKVRDLVGRYAICLPNSAETVSALDVLTKEEYASLEEYMLDGNELSLMRIVIPLQD